MGSPSLGPSPFDAVRHPLWLGPSRPRCWARLTGRDVGVVQRVGSIRHLVIRRMSRRRYPSNTLSSGQPRRLVYQLSNERSGQRATLQQSNRMNVRVDCFISDPLVSGMEALESQRLIDAILEAGRSA